MSEWTVEDHEAAIAAIYARECSHSTYNAKRVDESLADMQYHARRIRYLKSGPEQRHLMDWAEANGMPA